MASHAYNSSTGKAQEDFWVFMATQNYIVSVQPELHRRKKKRRRETLSKKKDKSFLVCLRWVYNENFIENGWT